MKATFLGFVGYGLFDSPCVYCYFPRSQEAKIHSKQIVGFFVSVDAYTSWVIGVLGCLFFATQPLHSSCQDSLVGQSPQVLEQRSFAEVLKAHQKTFEHLSVYVSRELEFRYYRWHQTIYDILTERDLIRRKIREAKRYHDLSEAIRLEEGFVPLIERIKDSLTPQQRQNAKAIESIWSMSVERAGTSADQIRLAARVDEIYWRLRQDVSDPKLGIQGQRPDMNARTISQPPREFLPFFESAVAFVRPYVFNQFYLSDQALDAYDQSLYQEREAIFAGSGAETVQDAQQSKLRQTMLTEKADLERILLGLQQEIDSNLHSHTSKFFRQHFDLIQANNIKLGRPIDRDALTLDPQLIASTRIEANFVRTAIVYASLIQVLINRRDVFVSK